jgi:DNA-binding Lrp family transcriptional regulator
MAYENLDSKLVNALLNDGRASLRSLAEELDVSVTTISNHLSALEESGAITGYTPKVNYALEEVTEQLRGEERMISVYEVTGDDDVVAIGKFRDTDEMNDQIKRLVSDANVKGSNTSVVLSAPVENRQFELEIDE